MITLRVIYPTFQHLSMASQTLSAPAHNMFAEQTLGLADYHFRNAHNVKIGFVDAKVKSIINKMLPWLCSNLTMSRKNFYILYRTGSKDEVASSHP